jgi:hypothetical protein
MPRSRTRTSKSVAPVREANVAGLWGFVDAPGQLCEQHPKRNYVMQWNRMDIPKS